jgi:uroporphyrin-III C-methyltransferase
MSNKEQCFEQISQQSLQPNTLGKVYLVGAGPGAVDLITVRGAKLLAKADIVFYDALVDLEMLELCPQAKKIAVGKRCGKLSSAQQFINKRLVDAAQKYQTVVRLKGVTPCCLVEPMKKSRLSKWLASHLKSFLASPLRLLALRAVQKSLTLRGVSRSVAFITQGASL